MKVVKISKKAVLVATKAIKQGKVVIFPTDTIYGFLALAENKKAVEKIYKIKKRPKSKPLPVFVKDIKMAKQLAEIDNGPASAKGYGVAKPGKITFIFKRKNNIKLYDGGKGTIALRIPKYKALNDLLKKINRPLAQTSVNISGQPAMNKITDITKQFGATSGAVLIIDAGNLPKNKPSKIVDLTGKVLTRIR